MTQATYAPASDPGTYQHHPWCTHRSQPSGSDCPIQGCSTDVHHIGPITTFAASTDDRVDVFIYADSGTATIRDLRAALATVERLHLEVGIR